MRFEHESSLNITTEKWRIRIGRRIHGDSNGSRRLKDDEVIEAALIAEGGEADAMTIAKYIISYDGVASVEVQQKDMEVYAEQDYVASVRRGVVIFKDTP